jgi:hypothetical protein
MLSSHHQWDGITLTPVRGFAQLALAIFGMVGSSSLAGETGHASLAARQNQANSLWKDQACILMSFCLLKAGF